MEKASASNQVSAKGYLAIIIIIITYLNVTM